MTKDIDMKNFGPRLKLLRVINEWSQADLADRLLVTKQALSSWETGAKHPTVLHVLGITYLFDLPFSYFTRETVTIKHHKGKFTILDNEPRNSND